LRKMAVDAKCSYSRKAKQSKKRQERWREKNGIGGGIYRHKYRREKAGVKKKHMGRLKGGGKREGCTGK